MIWVAAATLMCSAAGVSQTPTSTSDVMRRPTAPPTSELARTDRVFRDLVSCVIRRQPARTRNLLDTIPGSYEEGTILTSFDSRMESCYDYFRTGGRALEVPLNVLRGTIAESYYNSEFSGGISAAAVPSEHAASWVQPRPIGEQISQIEMLHAMARCVTIRQPAGVHAVMRATPYTPAEAAAFRTLQPDLSACLDSGIEFTASRQVLRGLLAEAALHYAESQRDGFGRIGRMAARTD